MNWEIAGKIFFKTAYMQLKFTREVPSGGKALLLANHLVSLRLNIAAITLFPSPLPLNVDRDWYCQFHKHRAFCQILDLSV